MKLFRLIRLGAWSCLLAVCLVVFLVNYCLQRTLVSQEGIRAIADQSHAYQIVRDNIIAPHIKEQVAASSFSNLVTDTAIKAALAKSLTDDQMRQLSPSVIDGIYRWLDSKEPRITFSVDTTQVNARFGEALATEVTTVLNNKPACTSAQTFVDALGGACKSDFLSERQRETIIREATAAAVSAMPSTVTDQTVPLPAALSTRSSDVPSLLNMLYAAHLIAGALGIMSALWLLLKWRLRGIAALGLTALLAALGIGIVTAILSAGAQKLVDPPYQAMITATVAAFNQQLVGFIPPLVISGICALLVGIGGIIIWRKYHRNSRHSPSLPPTDTPPHAL